MKTTSADRSTDNQLNSRRPDSLWPLFQTNSSKPQAFFWLATSDLGVALNGGRIGSRWGAHAILAQLKKMAAHPQMGPYKAIDCWKPSWEAQGLSFAQTQATNELQAQMRHSLKQACSQWFHIGGGHDHIFPLLVALEKTLNKPLLIFNLDAHADTRQDALPHSGTPFRQFDQVAKDHFELIQIGLHQWSNSQATLAPLKQGRMHRIDASSSDPRQLTEKITHALQHFNLPLQHYHPVISLDCDGLDASWMEAVSAVNPRGLHPGILESISQVVKSGWGEQAPTIGIYEHNPLYDNLSAKGAKLLASWIYNQLQQTNY